MRTEGAAFALAVARLKAFGSGISELRAVSNQWANCSKGFSSSVTLRSISLEYCSRWLERSISTEFKRSGWEIQRGVGEWIRQWCYFVMNSGNLQRLEEGVDF